MKETWFDNSNDINRSGIEFLRSLYNIMDEYNIHRIYNISLNKKKIIVAQQLLSSIMGTTHLSKLIFKKVDKYTPSIYFNICIKFHIFKYKKQLKKLFNKYGVDRIEATSFSLHQGIFITNGAIEVRKINLVYNDERLYHIENLRLDI